MESIRIYTGEIRICASCGQPCHLAGPDSEAAGHWMHFIEQWDGIHCDMFPLSDEALPMQWSEWSLQQVKEEYDDSSGPAFPGRVAGASV